VDPLVRRIPARMMWVFHACAEPDSADAKYWFQNATATRSARAAQARPRSARPRFIFLSTYYRWYQLTKDPALNEVLIEAGRTLAMRFNEQGQYLRSFVAENSLFIDIMMNIASFFTPRARRGPAPARRRAAALVHDAPVPGSRRRIDGARGPVRSRDRRVSPADDASGYRGDSCWSRGLAWALYGFTSCFEYSRDPRFLATAQACADYYISHSPADGVPPWDFNAPPGARVLLDTSAAAIAAAGLHRLCRLVSDPMKGHFYWSTAQHVLKSLCEKHTARRDSKWEGILRAACIICTRNSAWMSR